MQQGNAVNVTNSNLSDYYDISGNSIYESTELNKIRQVRDLNYANLSGEMRTLSNALITKYDKLAQSVPNNTTLKKVPGKHIYIVEGGKDNNYLNFNLDTYNTINVPMTFIVKDNVDIQGSISQNILVLATGRVRFSLPKPDNWRN